MTANANREADAASRPAKALVWDLVVRICLWTVVLGCLADLFVFEEGEAWRRRVGYVIAAALIVRAIWGFVGPGHARFADFLPRPSELARCLGDMLRGREQRFLGHNPAGGVMMLALMSLQALEDVHETLANSILVLAGLHAGAALHESWRKRENLALSMVTGYKRA